MVSARLKKGLRHAAMAKDVLVVGGILMRSAVGQIAVSRVADWIASSFVPRTKTCRSGARGDGCGAW